MTDTEISRLRSYHNFDDDVLEQVAEIAEQQRSGTWQTLKDSLPQTTIYVPEGSKPIEVLDIIPKAGNEDTQVYHLPMGNALDENMTTRVATLAAVQPTKRLIAVSNPGAPGQGTGKIKIGDLRSVWKGDLRATVEPTLQYLNAQGISTASHVGYSYGADRAATAAQFADKYDQQVPQSILMEPAPVKKRSLISLARDFGSTSKALEFYIDAADSDTYREARRLAEKRGHGILGYTLGLARLSNLAIAHALAKDGFEGRVESALLAQAEMRADIVWGSDSELAINALMQGLVERLILKYGPARVNALVLPGQKHAMGDDIFLQSAMVLQAQKAK